MNPKKKKIIRILTILIVSGVVIGGGIMIYMFNMPHRNVQNANADFSLSTSHLVVEYLTNANSANEKYLSDDGDSKIIDVTGTISEISENYDGLKVVLLKEANDKAGVSCVFLTETNINATKLKLGETATIKGVIRSGAGYDEDLELYENVLLDKCDVVIK